MSAAGGYGCVQRSRWGHIQGAVQGSELDAEQPVKIIDAVGGVVVAEPPEPVRCFTYGQQAGSGFRLFFAQQGNSVVESGLGICQQIPGVVLVGAAYPGREAAIHPAAGNQVGEGILAHPVACFGKGGALNDLTVAYGLVQRVQEVVSVVGVILPGVFTVENDGNHMITRFVAQGTCDPFKVSQEIGDRVIGMPFAVFESDEVGQAVITKIQQGLVFVQPVGDEQGSAAGHVIGVAGGGHATVVPDGFAGSGPADVKLVQQFQGIITHGAFGKPDSLRPESEKVLETLYAVAQMPARALHAIRVVGMLRHGGIRLGFDHVVEIVQQGHDGVSPGSHGYFDLSSFRQLAVAGDDAFERFLDDLQQGALVFAAETSGLFDEQADFWRLFQPVAAPGEVIPHEQIHEILLIQIGKQHFLSRLSVGAGKLLQQRVEMWVGIDHARGMCPAAGLDQFPAFVDVWRDGGGASQQVEQWVGGGCAIVQKRFDLLRIVVQLLQQHRRKVHHGLHPGIFFQMIRHVIVVLDAMQVDPGQLVIAIQPFSVVGLVHMPAQNQVQFVTHVSSGLVKNRSCPSISGVTSTIPLAVIWKRLASSSGFSPMTVPSAI